MEIYLKHPLVVWSILAPIAFVIIVGTLIFLVISLLPSFMVEELVARYTRKDRN
jgi:Na+/H+ antiporter NhaC